MAYVQQFLSTAAASTSCRLFVMLQNRTVQNHPGTCLRCSPFASAENLKYFPRKSRICLTLPNIQPKVLRVKSEKNFHLLGSDADLPCPFSAIRIKPQFGYGSSNTAFPLNVSNYGLKSGLSSTFLVSSRRSFSQVTGTVLNPNNDGGAKKGGSGKNSFFKILSKRRKRPNVFSSHQVKAIDNEELARSSLEGKTAAVENDVSISNDQLLQNSTNFSNKNKTQTPPNGKGKSKQRSRSNKNQNQPSKAGAPTDAADQPIDSEKVSKPKKTRARINKKSSITSEIDSTASAPTEVMGSGISVKDVSKKMTKNSRRKGKSVKEAHSVIKSDEKVTVSSSDNEVSQRWKSQMINKTKQGEKTWRQLYPPTSKTVMIVESATKAKVIQGYLGNMFEVLPSYGHVRDLAARSGSVRPDDDFSMVWEVPSAAWTHLKGIKVALSGAENLILASDPDREGEAIAWHIIEMLQQQDALREDINVARVVFNEITESSIRSALQTPREIDANLVHAYLARRALDYLIGFNISPLLWRKLPGCQSAGRVQSAALALICDREKEIDEFKAQEYWTIEVEFRKKDPNSANSISLTSHLTHCDSRKLNQLSISSFLEAKDIERKITMSKFEVISSKTSKSQRNPPPPYITSTLQQDAANKLNFPASYTMKVAQKLYEGVQLSNDKATGLITYMRTDGLYMSDEVAKDVRSFIMEKYGENFASKSTRKYFKKVKNAQEAHEAIRPTDIRRLPSRLVGVLDEDSLKLYTLIWSRTMACQMEPAIIEQIQIDVGNADQSIVFRSTGSRVTFLGHRAAYEDADTRRIRCDEDEEKIHSEIFVMLSHLKYGQPLCLGEVDLDQHYTLPPPRYSEGSLVKKLEELGIGRPSTYATTIKVLKDRNYVTTRSRILHPEFRGRMVSAFLSHYFSEVTDFSFTADMETELDNVSAGLTEWKGLLRDYWTRFSKYCEQTSNVHIHQVEKMLEKTFGDFLFASLPSGSRICPSCSEGTLIFKVSRFGSGYFIGCDQHPKCKYIAKTLYGEGNEEDDPENNKSNVEEPKLLGLNPGSKEKVLLKKGPYGFYVQLGEDRKGYLPKRASVSQIKDVDSITLEVALELLRYPVTLGNHPDDDQPVVLKLAKVGFSIRHRRTIASVPKNMIPNEVTLEKALELLKSKDVRRCGRPKREVKVEEPVEAI
ncbi:DNA topoisomerase [Abeliophyllum distichum]|uniref:DNA topoisomerase n=1 Tax=Abeliophyllum distichum TaxID=126358 RepID=A0ABD1V5T6_9LAMI